MTENVKDLICQATRAYWLHDYKEAVKLLAHVSELLVKEHGDDKYDGLGNVYLYYGKTLLELVREAGDPLGEVVPREVGVAVEGDDDGAEDEEEDGDDGEDDGESDDDEDAEGGKNEEGEAGSQDTEVNSTDISMNGEAASSQEGAKDSEGVAKPETAEDSGEDEKPETAEDSAEDEEEEVEANGEDGDKEDEEPSDLQLAWEVLELAKQIFQKRGDSGKEDYADCLITLGEVSMENENFESAIADIRAGLEIQKEIYTEGKDMRKLAHSHYMLGMALCADCKSAESMTSYETTLRIMKERLALLEAIEKPGASDEQEITEIKSLIPEVEEKITDLQNYIEECAKRMEQPEVADDEKPQPSSPEKKATDISHLVKRKRDDDGDGDRKSSAIKKPAPAAP